ncbi:MAG: T9SS type A sorting domain-containing protein [Flavobacteriales bacterium]
MAFIGIQNSINGSNWREYAQGTLTYSLLPNVKYCLSIPIVTSEATRYGSDGFGAFLSDTAIFCQGDSCVFQFTPHVKWPDGVPMTDTMNWNFISGIYIANGTENFITIGCFKPDSLLTIGVSNPNSIYISSVYYFIDNVSLTLCRPPVLADDTIIVFGNSIIIGDTAQDVANYYWTPSIGLSCDTCWQTIATPAETTTYTLTKITPCDTTSSQITISMREPDFTDYSFSLSPNPGSGIVQLQYSSDKEIRLHIYNTIGQVIQSTILPASTIGNTVFDLSGLSAGVYVFRFDTGDKVFAEKLVLENH